VAVGPDVGRADGRRFGRRGLSTRASQQSRTTLMLVVTSK
jgi:hypothetical protein